MADAVARRSRKPRPKLVAAGSAGGSVVVVDGILALAGVDVDAVPSPVHALIVLAVAVAAGYVKRDGLAGAWDRVLHGDEA